MASPAREEFEKWVHDALNHLYDSAILDNLPLVDWLLPADRRTNNRSQDLRRSLIVAIQSMKPARNTPMQSRDWRGYQILEQRFLSGLSPAEVLRQLNISRSLFFTEQALVLKRFSDLLWEQRILTHPEPSEETVITQTDPSAPVTTVRSADSESARLLEGISFGPIALRPLLQSLQPIIDSLAKGRGVSISLDSQVDETIEHGERVLLRQIIISLIAELAYIVPGGSIEVGAYQAPSRFGIRLRAKAGELIPEITMMEERQGLSPETSREVLAAMGGRLEVHEADGGGFEAILEWAKERGIHQLLLVEDHEDVAELFRRFLHGMQWEVLHAPSAAKAREVLTHYRPDLILLDVILPNEDGWELLVELKADSRLRSIPVIVCSAVNEPELVRSLGADGYLPKPIVQVELVKALRNY